MCFGIPPVKDVSSVLLFSLIEKKMEERMPHFQYVRFYSEIIIPIYNQRNELIQIFHECNFHSCIADHAGRMGAPIIIGGGDKGIRVDQYGRTLMLYLNPTS